MQPTPIFVGRTRIKRVMGPKAKCRIRPDRARKDGTFPIHLTVTWDRVTRRDIPMDILIKDFQFDAEAGRVKRSHPNASDYNLLLGEAEAKANEIFIRYRLADRELTPDAFLQEYHHPERKSDFIDFYEREMLRRWSRGVIADSSKTSDNTVLKKLRMFKTQRNKAHGWPSTRSVTFADIDLKWMEEFDLWHLKYLRKSEGDGLKNNGSAPRWTAFKKIKTYLKLASESLGIQINANINRYKIQKPGAQKCALTLTQLKRIMVIYKRRELLDFELEQVVRAFLFSCFTGLRYSDIERITYEQISGGTLTLRAWKTRRQKMELLSIPLPMQALSLLDPQRTSDTVFKLSSNVMTNKRLKKLADLAGMRGVKLSFKWSRDTFATSFLHLGGAVEVLQKLLGHSKITDTMIYVTISEERKRQQMTVWNGLD